jgi:hypothetical protein
MGEPPDGGESLLGQATCLTHPTGPFQYHDDDDADDDAAAAAIVFSAG